MRKRLKENVKTIETLFPDKTLQKEFTEFLNTKNNPPIEDELTTHGGELNLISPSRFIGNFLGAYNPETITYDTFSKMKLNPQLAAGVKLIKLPILGQNWSVECEDKEIQDFIHNSFKPLWHQLLGSVLTFVEFGVSMHEIVVKHNKKRRIIPKKFKSLFPEWIKIRTDKKDNFAGITQVFQGDDVVVPLNRSLVITHDKGDSFGNLFGTSRLKPCYETWYWWVSIMQFMLRYFEKKGTPPVIVRFPPGKDRTGTLHSDTALSIGKALMSETVVAIASSRYTGGAGEDNRKWDLEYLTDDKRGEMFITALSFLDAKLLRGLFIPERVFTQDVSGKAGSYALSKVHADMFLLGEEGLIVDIEWQLNKYAVRRFVEWNFGEDAPPCHVRIERITEARKQFLKTIFLEMVKKGTAIPSIKQVAEEVGVPIDENGEIIIPKKENEKENEKKETEQQHDCSKHSIELQDRKNPQFPWRDATERENVKVLTEIQDTLNTREEEIKDDLEVNILIPQIEQVSKKVSLHLKKNLPLRDIWFRKVNIVDEEGEEKTVKISWTPLRPKLMLKLKAIMREFYLLGQKTSIEEIGVEVEPIVGKEGFDLIQSRSIAVGDRYMSNLKYLTELVLLTPNNKTDEDLITEIKGDKVKGKMRNVHIETIAEVEPMTFLNLGRKKIVDQFT